MFYQLYDKPHPTLTPVFIVWTTLLYFIGLKLLKMNIEVNNTYNRLASKIDLKEHNNTNRLLPEGGDVIYK